MLDTLDKRPNTLNRDLYFLNHFGGYHGWERLIILCLNRICEFPGSYLLSNDEGEHGKPEPWLYLVVTVIWTWGCYAVPLITDQSLFSFPNILFYAAGGLGPLIVSTFLVSKGYWDGEFGSAYAYLKRSLDPGSLSSCWYFIISGLVLLLSVTPLLFDPSRVVERGLFTLGPVSFLLIGAVFGGLEEVGWRGYAQEGLQRRLPVFLSSIVIGVFWALWHIPLFFMEGTYQQTLGVGTPEFWVFNIAVVIGSPIYAWIYNATGRTFSAVFYHALGNIAGELFIDSPPVADIVVEVAFVIILTVASWDKMKRKTR